MPAYSKAIFRVVVFFALVLGAIVLYKPAAVSAFVDCCQTCEDRYQQCVSGCTTQACKSGCELQLERCIEICPACL